MFEPKIPVVCAAVGFVLSLLVGIISGAAFLAVLIRALGMALLFGSLSLGARLAVGRFLPELASGGPEAEEASGTGGLVDITIDGDGKSPDAAAGPEMDVRSGLVPDFAGQRPASGPEDAFGLTGTPGSVVEPDFRASRPASPPSAGAAATPGGSPGRTASPGTGVPAELSGGSRTNARPQPAPAKPAPDFPGGDLDILPDLQDFVPVAKPDDASSSPADFGSSPADQSYVQNFAVSDLQTSTEESETMVKAIRTMLSHDT